MDNYGMWERYQDAMDKRLARRPVCSICGEHVQENTYYNLDGTLYCHECMDSFLVQVEG